MSLRVWLPLNGNLDNLGLDEVTITNNNVTINDNGKIGKCYEFGSSKYLYLLNYAPTFLTFNTWSLSVWFKCTAQNTAHTGSALISSGNWNYANSLLNLALSTFSSDHYTKLLISGSGNWAYGYSYDFYLDTWYHVVLTSGNGAMRAYVNGQLIGDSYNAFCPESLPQADICIGNATYAKSFNFYGLMNDVRIYDHCLSPKEVKEISQGLILHYKLDNVSYGDNLLDITAKSISPTAYLAYQLNLTENLLPGQSYTLQLWDINVSHTGKTDSSLGIGIYWGGGSILLRSLIGTNYFTNGHADYICCNFTTSDTTSSNAWLNLYNSPTSATGDKNMSIGSWKLQKNINPSTAVDNSGYNHYGIKYGILYSPDSIKYNISSKFNGSNSYIKVNDNTWMAQAMPAMTINMWAKADTWPTNGGRLVSCTETGGFNLEAGNSGYWRFPIHVYTAADLSSTAYKYDSNEIKISDLVPDSWNMITLVYTTEGTKTYINGVLNHTYTNTSYGIHYNKNARLFLGCEANTASPYTPYFNGQMSEFRIYATALFADDILELYNTSASIDSLGKIYSFEFNDSNGAREIFNDYATWTSTTDTSIVGVTYNPTTGLALKGYTSVYSTSNNGFNPGFYEIKNTGYTYQYDLEYSNNDGNQIYIGFERFDANKTATSNSSTIYILSTKTAHENTKVSGTVNLAQDINGNTVKYIRPRILNNWSGSTTTGVENTLNIKYFTLREVPSTGNKIQSIGKNGITSCEEMIENESTNFHKDGFIETIEFIER